jgi:hypothetical protein
LDCSIFYADGSGVNTANNYVWANVSHFSDYAVGGDWKKKQNLLADRTGMPLMDQIAELALTLKKDRSEYEAAELMRMQVLCVRSAGDWRIQHKRRGWDSNPSVPFDTTGLEPAAYRLQGV